MTPHYIFIDLETTGLHYLNSEITQVSFTMTNIGLGVLRKVTTYVRIVGMIPDNIVNLTGITKSLTNTGMRSTDIGRMLEDINYSYPDLVWVAQNAPFDLSFLTHHYNVTPRNWLCTRSWAKMVFPGMDNPSLKSVYNHLYKTHLPNHHTADGDVKALISIFKGLKKESKKDNIKIPFNTLVKTGRPVDNPPFNTKKMIGFTDEERSV